MPTKTPKKPAKTVKSKSTTKAKAKTKATPKTSTKAKTTSKAKPKPSSKTPTVYDYEALLQRAREEIPPEVFDQPRFQLQKVDAFIQGSRTVIRNFKDLTDTLRRDPKHLLRYLAHELATAGEVRGTQAIFNGRFTHRVIEELMERYTAEFVVCPICHRPDTEIRRENRLLILVCSACGGRTPLKG